jgi:MFS family permease
MLGGQQLRRLLFGGAGCIERPHRSGTVVAEHVRAVKRRNASSIYVAAGHGAAVLVCVRGDRQREPLSIAVRLRLVARVTLHDVPSVVQPSAVRRHPVDLLQFALADIGYPDVVAVEAEAPRVAEAVGPNLRARVVAVDERIVGGNAVGSIARRRVDIDPQQLAEQSVEPLTVVVWIPRTSAVAKRDVQVSVRPELERAAVVIRVWLIDPEQDARGIRQCDVFVGRVSLVLGNDRIAVYIGVVDEESAVRPILGVKGQAEQSLLTAGGDLFRDVEKRLLNEFGVAYDSDATDLFDDEEATAPVTRIRYEQGRLQPVDDGSQLDRGVTEVERGRGRRLGGGRAIGRLTAAGDQHHSGHGGDPKHACSTTLHVQPFLSALNVHLYYTASSKRFRLEFPAMGDPPIERPTGRPPERRGRGVLLDIGPLRTSRDFRLLWLGSTISFLGTQITFVAVPFQVFELTRSAFAVGLLGLCELVPLLTLSLVGGAIADQVDRRTLLLWTDAVMATTSILLVVNSVVARPQLWALYALTAVWAALYAIASPALRSATPLLLGRDQLPAAAALQSVGGNAGLVVGPLIGGVLIEAVGLAGTYGIDVATYAMSLAAVRAARPIPPVTGDDADRVSVLDGVRFLRGRPVLQGSFIVDLIAMIFGMPRALFPAIAAQTFAGGAGVVGILYAAPAVGSFVAGAFSGWTGRIRRQGVVVYIAVVAWGVSLVVFGIVESLALSVVALAAAGAADMVSGIFRSAILQTAAPQRMQGRLSGVELFVVASGPSLGDVEAGALASLTSLRFSVVFGGVGCVAGVAVMALLLPQFARYDARSPSP